MTPEWIKAFSRHITTIAIVLAAVWWLATPRLQEFINQAVDDRITRVENMLDTQKVKLNEIILRLQKIDRQQEYDQ